MGVSMSTLVGWAVVLAVGGLFLYRDRKKKSLRVVAKTAVQRHKEDQRNALQARRDKEKEKETKARRQRVGEPASERESNAAKSKQQQPPQQPQPASYSKAASYSSDDDVDNREFAKQLSSVKQGTKFTAKSKDDVRHKSVKQSRAEEGSTAANRTTVDEGKVSAPSSTAGIDADDDQSSVASPVVSAVNTAGDVSDMLEKPASGPSVLRLTDTEEKKKPKKIAKAPEPAESKKQRQNRKKVEAAKLAREEAEEDRKARLEAHKRTVRLAEGRAAKDGSGFMAAQAKGNVWTGNNNNTGVNGNSNGTNGFLPVQPLDTFENKPATEANPSASAKSSTSGSKTAQSGQSDSWMSSLPSEEEQLEMLREEEEWSTVKTKPRKIKKKGSPSESNDEAAVSASEPQKPASVEAEDDSAWTTVPTTSQSTKMNRAAETHRPVKAFTQKSSFAALSTDGPAEPEEEEWDV